MNPITITKVEKKDILELQRIGKVTFSETNTAENMQKYLEESFAVCKRNFSQRKLYFYGSFGGEN